MILKNFLNHNFYVILDYQIFYSLAKYLLILFDLARIQVEKRYILRNTFLGHE